MCKRIKSVTWLLLTVFSIANSSIDNVLQKFAVEKNSDIPSTENMIANVSAISKLHCALWCMIKDVCCSSVHDKSTGTCCLYSCCSPTKTVAEDHDKLTKQPQPACEGLRDKCPVNQGYIYDSAICLCLKYIPLSVVHDVAVADCAADYGELVKIDSPCKQQKVESFLASIFGMTSDYVWIQGDESTGIFRFDDGTEMVYFNWNTDENQPTYVGTEEPYIAIKISSQYRWHDGHMNHSLSALCEVI